MTDKTPIREAAEAGVAALREEYAFPYANGVEMANLLEREIKRVLRERVREKEKQYIFNRGTRWAVFDAGVEGYNQCRKEIGLGSE